MTANASAPAVNDYHFVLSDHQIRTVWCGLLDGNPMLILLAVRPTLRQIGKAWGTGHP